MTTEEVLAVLAPLVARYGTADAEAARSDALARHLADPWRHAGGLRRYFHLLLARHRAARLIQPGDARYAADLVASRQRRPPRRMF